MKKIIRYMQDQALQASNQRHSGPAYLSPREKEPQQRERHHGPSYHQEHTSHHQSRSSHPSTASHSFPTHDSGGGAYRGSDAGRGSSDVDAFAKRRTPSPLPDKVQRDITRHQYAQDNILQSYELYIPELNASHISHAERPKYWILYVHGGYFRDDDVTSASFHPALSILTKPPRSHLHPGRHDPETENHIPHVAGYASINYRLSPRPTASPQDPNTTSAYELRDAAWPDHIRDVLAAIAHLQSKYHFGERYLLVGHSVGATMALLSTLASERSFSSSGAAEASLPKIEPPMAVAGVSGIYDFELLHQSFPSGGYEALTRNAIPNPGDDDLASPGRYSRQDYQSIWARSGGKKRALILAHSRDDGLVDWKQVEAMETVLADEQGAQTIKDGNPSQGGIATQVVEIKGLHNDIWGHGTELAKVIRIGVGVLRQLEGK